MQKHVLNDMLEPVVEALGYELVRVITLGQVNPTLQVMIDRIDGKTVDVEDCARVSRKISELLDEKDPIAGEYTLEVSSPGVDRPLTKFAHFEKVVGQNVKVELSEEVNSRKRIKGLLVKTDGQKTVFVQTDETVFEIPFEKINKAKITLTQEDE